MIKIIGAVLTWLTVNAAWITALVNFIWLLVKDVTLFSWWVPIGFAIAFIVSLLIVFIGIINE